MTRTTIALSLILILAATFGLSASSNTATAKQQTPTATTKGPSLEMIKKLAGKWYQRDENGKPTDQLMTQFRVTAGGSAVLETIMPGTAHEMITMYYQDGDTLMLTHYCAMQNQPTMKGRLDDKGRLIFDFVSGTNMKPSDPHMHHAEYTFLGDDHFLAVWDSYAKGEKTYTAKFDVVRRKKAGESL